MKNCSECYAKINSGATFCADCGEPVAQHADATESTENTTVETDGGTAVNQSTGGIRWPKVLAGAIVGLLIGFFAWMATVSLDTLSVVAFVLGWVGGGYYVYTKPSVSHGIGSGLYVTAVLILLTPITFYLPGVFDEGMRTSSGNFTGPFFSLVVWVLVFLLFANIAAGVGYLFKRRARA